MILKQRNMLTSRPIHWKGFQWMTKALYMFLLGKIVYVYPLAPILVDTRFRLSHELRYIDYLVGWFRFPPLEEFASILLLILGVFLLVAIWWRLNLVMAVLVFLVAYNVFHLTVPMNNGADYILITFLFNSVIFQFQTSSNRLIPMGTAIKNGAVLLTMMQIGIIYMLSGLDKLASPSWRSGEAMAYIIKLHPGFVTDGIRSWLPRETDWVYLLLSWITIVSEIFLSFGFWIRPLRRYAIWLGAGLHFFIGFFMSLPEFALLMILSYFVFLEDETLLDWERRLMMLYKRITGQKPASS